MKHVRWYLVWGPAIVGMVGAILILIGLIFLVFRQPPIRYSEDIYQTDRAVYAPGDTLFYTPTLTMKVVGVYNVTRTFWRIDDHPVAYLCDGTAAPPINTPDRGTVSDVLDKPWDAVVRVPVPDLQPGSYVLGSIAHTIQGGQSPSKVYFSVTRPCPTSR